MAKYYGKVGFARTVENTRGIYNEEIIEKFYAGDVVRNTRRLQTDSKVNPDIVISYEISILADPYAVDNFHSIRTATYLNSKWTVSSVRLEYPRLILTLGNLYTTPMMR